MCHCQLTEQFPVKFIKSEFWCSEEANQQLISIDLNSLPCINIGTDGSFALQVPKAQSINTKKNIRILGVASRVFERGVGVTRA